MAILPSTTGTYQFVQIPASDILYDAWERAGWRAASLTPDMMLSAQRSFNFVQAAWSNLGVNLWEVSQQSITLVQGVASYTVDPTTIDVLPSAVIKLWQLTNQTNVTPNLTTVSSSTSVTVTQVNHGLSVGNYVNIATPISVGGIVLFGFYQVISVPSASTYTITSATAATSSTSGGQVPVFSTDGTTGNVLVVLNSHPFLAGQTFNVEVPVVVGGLTLSGQYLISATTTNNFTIVAGTNSTSAQSVTMNSGNAQIQSQAAYNLPTDRVLYPMSRADYTALAVKNQQGMPTSFWFDRIITPTITFWPVPDQNGPYQFVYYKNSQMQDASIQNGAQINIPYRFMEAYTSAVAAHLAMKWRPEVATQLAAYAQQMWTMAANMDTEKTSFYISPSFEGYFN